MVARTHELPREKLARVGVVGLSTRELIQLVIGSGTKAVRMEKLARKVEALLRNSTAASEHQLKGIKGIGTARSARLIASLELARRLDAPKTQEDGALDERLFSKLPTDHCRYLIVAANKVDTFSRTLPLAKPQHCVRSITTDIIEHGGVAIAVIFSDPQSGVDPSIHVIRIAHGVQQITEVLGIKVVCMTWVHRHGRSEL